MERQSPSGYPASEIGDRGRKGSIIDMRCKEQRRGAEEELKPTACSYLVGNVSGNLE